MNKEWSELNKTMQEQFRKEVTFKQGIETLLCLRQRLMDELLRMKQELDPQDFCAMPFPNAKGYHCKTIAYSIWHIMRIEDIVAHSLIRDDEEIFFRKEFHAGIDSPVITTGNELSGQQIVDFSRDLDIEQLYCYMAEVKTGTDELLKELFFSDLKRKFGEKDKERLKRLQVVSPDENAVWLIDYWCGKNIRGLIQMPFSRHWIMHVEAAIRIKDGIWKKK
ncbi:MAG: phage head-tail adapter protein [Lachnospiraceae bacterium]|nr:phage head-tail adapter protein [Lachnospiraceae bacterium]